MSQLISSQLNSLIAQVDQNLEIDFDLESLDETAMESFQLRVAYTFFDGRLRVMRDGGFTDLQGNANLNSIAGDWQAEYQLTEDGRYVIRVYNRTNFNNSLSSLNIKNPNTYGISLSQTLLFSSFRELFQNKNRRSEVIEIDMDEMLLDEEVEAILWESEPLEQESDATPIRVFDHPKVFRRAD